MEKTCKEVEALREFEGTQTTFDIAVTRNLKTQRDYNKVVKKDLQTIYDKVKRNQSAILVSLMLGLANLVLIGIFVWKLG